MIDEITIKDLKKVQKALKKMNSLWVEMLTEKIKKNNPSGPYSIVTVTKVYNVFNSAVKNGGWKIVVYKAAKELLTEFQKEIEDVKNL